MKHPMTHHGHSGTQESIAQPATRYLVDNEALPEAQYPSTALKHEDEYGAEALRPVWLQDVGHLAKIIADSRETIGVSNFAEVSTPRNSARTPAFPTFTRFSTTAFARSELGEARIIPGNRPGTGALFDLSYPVMLNVTDGRKVPLPGSSPQGIVDSQGYPLLYGADRPKKLIAARSSGALYPANLSRTLRNRMSTYPDATTVRTWAHMFQLSNEKDAQSILLQRVLGSAAGDNHIALLVKAYLAYFDNIVGALEGAVPARNRLSPEAVVINTNIVSGWTTRVLDSSAEIVNVLGGAPDYQEFWAYCSFDQPPIFAAKTSNETMTTSVFSHYRMHSGMSMVCICDREAYSAQRQPTFFGKPNLILGFIETYVQKFGLQQQANEALQIAMLWPTLVQANAHVSLPMALHAADWFGGEVERPSTETAYRGLISSSPYVALASTLAGAWALRSQIYDYVTLLAARRASWTLSSDTVQSCAAWLVRNASAPGVGWDFLLRHQFQVTPSLLYLTGLSVEVVDWSMLLSTFSWQEDEFPAHLRLIQPHWVKTSVCCTLPWERIWVPRFDTAGFLLSASPATIMCMLRLGLLRDTNRDRDQEEHNLGIFPILERPGTETIRYPDSIADQLRVVLDHGIRVLALSDTTRDVESDDARTPGDPADSRTTKERWPVSGLLQNFKLQEYEKDALLAQSLSHTTPGMVDPGTVKVAKNRLDFVKNRLHVNALRAAAVALKHLAERSSRYYKISDAESMGDFQDGKVIYTPGHVQDGGWWCLLFLARLKNRDQRSLACLRSYICRRAVPQASKLSLAGVEEMAGCCSIAQLLVTSVIGEKRSMVLRDTSPGMFMTDASEISLNLRVRGACWEVVLQSRGKSPTLELPNQRNMPTLRQRPSRSIENIQATRPEIAKQRDFSKTSYYNLPTAVRVLDTSIERWKAGLHTKAQVLALHRRLFPDAGLPRFLQNTFTSLSTQPDNRQHKTTDGSATSEHLTQVAQVYLKKHGGENVLSRLQEFKQSLAGDSEKCSATWPYRSIENCKKNNVSTADLLVLLETEISQEAIALWFMETHRGNHGEFVASVSLWLAATSLCEQAWHALLSTELFQENEDTWLARAQELHDHWRKNGLPGCDCNECWTQLLYLQNLWGRGGVEVDWEKEITNKIRVPDDIVAYTGHLWSATFASQIIESTIRDVLQTATKMLAIDTFDDFMDRAYEWLVSGSAAGMPSAFKDTPIRSIILQQYGLHPRPTKRSVMEKISRKHILRQLRSRPQIVAKLHQKLNETGGKARAIYGVTIWHYIFSNWLMAPFEKAIDHQNIDINIRNDKFLEYQLRRAQDAKKGSYFNSYDYPDFNSMHTHYHMSLIYIEASLAVRNARFCSHLPQAEIDLIMQGYAWLEKSVHTQVCFIPETDTFVQTIGGLYSGNRDTTLINTILNIAYAKVVDVSCANMGLSPSVNWRLCHGDDIITQHESYGSALAWNVVAEKAKLKGQEKKLLTDRSFHEYLRVMACPDGKLRGSLARVVATFVNGNWETDYTAGAHSKVVEVQSSLAILLRRGMRAALYPKLWKAAVRRLAASIAGESYESASLRSLLSQIASFDSLPEMKGGRSCHDGHSSDGTRSEQDFRAEQEGPAESEITLREKFEIERHFLRLPDEVTRPYATYLIGLLPTDFRQQAFLAQRLQMILQRTTYGSELPRRFQVETKQGPQLTGYLAKARLERAKRGRNVKLLDMSKVSDILGDYKILSSTIRRIKAIYALLSTLQETKAYPKSVVIADMIGAPESVVRNALVLEEVLQSDWRRFNRPAAAEVAALENTLEMYLTNDATLHPDEEVVLVVDDGLQELVPVRELLLY